MIHNERIPDEIILNYDQNGTHHRSTNAKKILKKYWLEQNQIENITTNNTDKQIKIIVTYIEDLYKTFWNRNINLEPDIATYIYEVFTDEVEE